MHTTIDNADLAMEQQARRVVTAVTLCLLADAMLARVHALGGGALGADLLRSLEFALVETQVRTGVRTPIVVC
jgi:hypothetical protein